jgi:hypothetical protein
MAVALVAALVPVAEATRNHAPMEVAILFAAFAAAAAVAWRLHAAFRATPTNFPVPAPPPPAIPVASLRVGYRKKKETER